MGGAGSVTTAHHQLDGGHRRHGRHRPRQSNNGTSFAALVQALRSDGSSNIISTPSLITMNNEEAEVKVTQEIPLITGSYSNTTAERQRHHQPVHDHSARGSGHDSEGHAAHQRRQLGAAQDRAGRFLAGREADGFGGYFHQQALHQDHGADRGWRHHRARRPDVGHRLAERGSRAGDWAPFPCSAICSSRAAARARRRTCWCSYGPRYCATPRPPRAPASRNTIESATSRNAEQRPHHRCCPARSSRSCRAMPPGSGLPRARAVRRQPAGCHRPTCRRPTRRRRPTPLPPPATPIDTARDDTARA